MKKILIVFCAALAFVSCSTQSKLIIIHTNDTHSHVEPLRSGERMGQGGVIERAAFIDSVRNAEGEDKVLLVDAGDFSQGTSYFTELKGMLEIEQLNAMKYDVVTLGNHEFDNNIEALAERLKNLKYTKVVCANLDLSSFELGDYVVPYTIVRKNGMKIGVIGLETDIRSVVASQVSSRIPVFDDVEVTNKWAQYLHKTEKCDMVILLSHRGYREDQQLIPQIRNVDIVIGGHSHTFVDDFIYIKDADGKAVPMIQDGSWGLEVGKITVY